MIMRRKVGRNVILPDFLNLFIDLKLADIDGKPVYVRGGRQQGRSPISIAIGGWVFLEENFSGSPITEACAGAVVE